MDPYGRPLTPASASGQHFGARPNVRPTDGYQGSSVPDVDHFALSTAYDKVRRTMLNPYNSNHLSEKDLDDFRFILQLIMQDCSRTNIESGKTWIFKNCLDAQEMGVVADLWLALSQSRTSFAERLHLIYLVNDVLFHSDRRQLGWMKDAILPRLVPLLRQAYHLTGITTGMKQKVIKVITIWSDKHFFEPAVIDRLRESILVPPPPPPAPLADMAPIAHPPMAPMIPMAPPHFNPGFRPPYPPPHAPPGYYPRPHIRPPPPIPPPGMHPRPPPPPKAPVYVPRPPRPVAATNSPHFVPPMVDQHPVQQEPFIEKSYHELPAGLMVPAVQQASAAYVAIHPSQIRMAPTKSTAELEKAVEDFYAGLDLKESTGDFEEQTDGKLDRGGWEPGYLDPYYEKLKGGQSGDSSRADVRNRQEYSRSRSRSPSRSRSRSYSPERGRSPDRRYGDRGPRLHYHSRSRSPSSRSRSSDSYASSRSRSRSPPRRSRSGSRSQHRYRSRSRSRSPSRGWHGGFAHTARSTRPPAPGGPGVLSVDTGGYLGQGHSRGSAEPYGQRACYNCSKPGHLARDCPESPYYRKRF